MPDPGSVRELHRSRVRSIADIRTMERFEFEQLRPADTILGCLSAVSAENPGKDAIILVEPPDLRRPASVVSFAHLVAAVEESASLFREIAGGPSAVGVMLPMIPESLTALWGAATAGVGVPLNPFLELGSLASILSRTKASALVTTREIIESKFGISAADLTARVPGLSRVYYTDDDSTGETGFVHALLAYRGRGLVFLPDPDPWRDAMVMPTGGTTGDPKLVRMSQAAQLSVASNVGALMGSEADGVVGHGMPNFHCGGSLSLGLRALMHGMTLVTFTASGFRSRWAVENFWPIASHYGITSVLATPTTASALLTYPGQPEPGHRLTDFHVGGSTLPVDLVESFHDRFGIWLRENWGMTEVHGTVVGHPNDRRPPRIGSAGVALPRSPVRAVILDEANRYVRHCEPDEKGVLLIGGPTITRGYLDAEQNESFFVHGMPEPGMWVNTGDIGLLDEDGYVFVSGRTKDLIIRGGHNIDPREIEDALGLHSSVRIVAAVGRPDRDKGELPVAYVQLAEGDRVTTDELMAFCRDKVQEKAATPVDVIVLDEMPVTPVGKIAKPVLRRMALESELRSAVDLVAGRKVDCEVLVDDSRARRKVIVRLHAGDGTQPDLEALRGRLNGYEFTTSVELAPR
ncbi:MAG TPA: AMP-binding protein [Trebonia sp.]|nr:AMP-binding protein [Trebonia sp.]